MLRYFDRQGKEITFMKWKYLMIENPFLYYVNKHTVGKYIVLTCWIGIAYKFTDNGTPIIFQTMVYPQTRPLEHYSTEEDALNGHRLTVKFYEKTTGLTAVKIKTEYAPMPPPPKTCI